MIRTLYDWKHTPDKHHKHFVGLSTDAKPASGLVTGSTFDEINTGKVFRFDEESGAWIEKDGFISSAALARVSPLENSAIASGNVIEAVGIPAYVEDVTEYSEYGITDTGWYIFARIESEDGETVSASTIITGAAGVIAEIGSDHIDVAVRFDVAAQSRAVTIDWGGTTEAYIFKATDLAVRNLDYRTTFYVYDLARFVSWTFAPTKDATVADGKKYYTKSGNTYTLAELTTGAACVCYYELVDEAYVLTEDATFVDGKTYYTTTDGTTYTEATVTAGEAVPTAYYNHSKLTIQGMTRNITYRLDETIDCPSEVILPAIEDETHGCWFEFQLRHSGKYSMTLTVPEGVKVATEHTQAEDTGFNLIDLHYMCIDNIKMWRFMNTHSSIPTS